MECHILDGDRVMGVGFVEVEVLFKGRFSDVGLPGFSVGTTSPGLELARVHAAPAAAQPHGMR